MIGLRKVPAAAVPNGHQAALGHAANAVKLPVALVNEFVVVEVHQIELALRLYDLEFFLVHDAVAVLVGFLDRLGERRNRIRRDLAASFPGIGIDHVAVDDRRRFGLPTAAVDPPELLSCIGGIGGEKIGAGDNHFRRPFLRLKNGRSHVGSRGFRTVGFPDDLARVLVHREHVGRRVGVAYQDHFVVNQNW